MFDYFAEQGGMAVLHPGGLEMTASCVGPFDDDKCVLDVACGRGAAALWLAEKGLHRVVGLDGADRMVALAKTEAVRRGLSGRASFVQGAASHLPFCDEAFDVVIIECTLSTFVDRRRVLDEMVRVVRPGGRLAIHDMAWAEDVNCQERKRLAPLILTDPETVTGWMELFRGAGLLDLEQSDETTALRTFIAETRREVGLSRRMGMIAAAWRDGGMGGVAGLLRFALSFERAVESGKLRYILLAGRKRE